MVRPDQAKGVIIWLNNQKMFASGPGGLRRAHFWYRKTKAERGREEGRDVAVGEVGRKGGLFPEVVMKVV